MVDWQFALHLYQININILDLKWGWLQPSQESKTDILGKYAHIDWRDDRISQPSEKELKKLWDDYIRNNGTFEEQEQNKKNRKIQLRDKLKNSNNPEIKELLELLNV